MTKKHLKSLKKRSLKIYSKTHGKINEFWSKIRSKIDPKIDAKIDAKIERRKKARGAEGRWARSAGKR